MIVDAVANLERFVGAGADMVVFSGGKAIRGPQPTGILAGKQEYVRSAADQHIDMHAAADAYEPPTDLIDVAALGGVPRQGIGRSLKIGKEELVGLIRALELFVKEDQEATQDKWLRRAQRVAAGLADASVTTELTGGDGVSVAPEMAEFLDPDTAGTTAATLARDLRQEDPRVFVGADAIDDGLVTINPMCLTDEEADYVVERIESYLG